jgi:hypothetical protein
MQEIAPLLVLFVTMAATILIIRMVQENGKSKRQAEAQLQLHTRLIDKIGSSRELLDYLASDAGKKFLTPATVQKSLPFKRILAAAQAGVVLTFVGLACWLVKDAFDQDAMRGVMFLGSISFALGLGFLCSAVLAHVLSRKWGLLSGNGNGADRAQ